MQVRVLHEDSDAKVAVIVDLEGFSTSSPHRDVVLCGNINGWRTDDDDLRFPWADDAGDSPRSFLPLRVEVPRQLDQLEFKLYDNVMDEWLEPFGYLQGAYANMEPYLQRNEVGSLNVCVPVS